MNYYYVSGSFYINKMHFWSTLKRVGAAITGLTLLLLRWTAYTRMTLKTGRVDRTVTRHTKDISP